MYSFNVKKLQLVCAEIVCVHIYLFLHKPLLKAPMKGFPRTDYFLIRWNKNIEGMRLLSMVK